MKKKMYGKLSSCVDFVMKYLQVQVFKIEEEMTGFAVVG
jgi:hypothetical protein